MSEFRPVKIVAVLGNSRTGKDELALILTDHYHFNRIHPIQDLKDFFECHFNLPQNIDTPEMKSFKPRGSKLTINELLVHLWQVWSDVCPEFSYPYVESQLKSNIQNRKNTVLTGIRNLHEVEAIQSTLNPDCELITIHVTRPGFDGLASDAKLTYIQSKLEAISHFNYYMVNSGSLSDWKNKCKSVAMDILGLES